MAQTRIVEDAGLIRLTQTEREQYGIVASFSLLRDNPQGYSNLKSRSRRSLFGYVELWTPYYLVSVAPIEFEQQILFQFQNDAALSIALNRCDNKGIGKSLENIANSLKVEIGRAHV